MTVTHYWNENQKTFPSHEETVKIDEHFSNSHFANLYVLSSAINGTAELSPPKGSATELAILKLLKKMDHDYESLRKKTTI